MRPDSGKRSLKARVYNDMRNPVGLSEVNLVKACGKIPVSQASTSRGLLFFCPIIGPKRRSGKVLSIIKITVRVIFPTISDCDRLCNIC